MTLAIDCQNLVKTYPGKPPVEAVRGIDFQVKVGECFGVLGPNGAGKTTTIEILEGLLPATSGSATILGMDWKSQAGSIRERIGVSLQETQLSDRLTVGETLNLFRSFYSSGITPAEAMGRVSLEEKKDSWIKTLSGGQKQRLAVATALVGDPELIFLDEPTTGLDPTSRRQLWEIIESFKEQNRTVMLTTHYMEEAERLCDRVAIFDAGKIIAEGSPTELIRSLGANHVIEFSTGEAPIESSIDWIHKLSSVSQVQIDDGQIRVTADKLHEVLPGLVTGLEERKVSLTGLSTREATLEDVFVKLTGKHLSDEADS
jgi:ABC-2 type transport system ATP-binding protein